MTKNENITYIPVDKLHPHPDNPRKDLGDLTELSASIREKGVMQNLTVVERDGGGYTVIIGHRRTAAAKLAGVRELPCIVVEMTPQEQLATMLLENMQRSDLNAYEQAQGFQMMLDFGESVETIAKKTGFSKTTVSRRLKIAELDQDVLKDVSTTRQITLGDLDRLSQIEDLEARNRVLKSIGTSNFEQSVTHTLKKQKIGKNLPALKEAIKALKCRKITRSETYSGKYTSVGKTVAIAEWKEGTPLLPDGESRKLFYTLDEDWGDLRFYVETPKAKPQKRPQAEIDREKYVEETRRQLDELSEIAFKLREDFIEGLTMTKANERKMLEGVIGTMICEMFEWRNSISKEKICERMGIKWDYGHVQKSKEAFLAKLAEDPGPYVPLMIFERFGVRSDTKYYTGYKREFPKHQECLKLDMMYKWLMSLGYEPSDDERGLMDGTHPLFVDKDEEA